MSKAFGDTVETVRAPMVDAGLLTLGSRIGHALEKLERDGIDIQQAEIEIAIEPYDEHSQEWVARISWPFEAEPEDYNEPWPSDSELEQE